MRIERIKIDGFGSFNKGIDADLSSDRVSLVIGRNEAGKSTLMSAVFGVLFGFKDSSLQKRFEPWDSYERFGGEVHVRRDDGRLAIVRRDFSDNTAEISEENSSGEMEDVFLGSANPRGYTDEDIDFYRRLETIVGFQDEAIFRDTVFVGQNALQTSITDQIRRLVSGSGSTDFKGVLHDLHSRFSELTKENPWGQRGKAKPRRIEKLGDGLVADEKRLVEARENFMITMGLEQEVRKLEEKVGAQKSQLEDHRKTLGQFERFCKLLKDRDGARERFTEANKRRETYLRYKEKVTGIDSEIRTSLSRFTKVGEEFPELVTRLKAETRELEQEEAALDRDRNALRHLKPVPNNKLGAILAVLGAVIGAAMMQVVAPLVGGAAIAILGVGLFFLGRTVATGFKERQSELEHAVKQKSEAARQRGAAIREIIEASGGILGEDSPDEILSQYRRFRSHKEDRERRISAMRVLGDWEEIDASYQRAAEQNLRCNGLLEVILEDAPYLTEISGDSLAVAKGVEEVKRQIAELSEEIEVTQEVATEAKIRLARATADSDYDIPELEDAVDSNRRELERLLMERDALHVVIDTLEECVTEFQEGDLTNLSEEVSEIFRRITGNRYTRVTLSPNMEPMLTKYDNTHIQPGDLSQGTEDQLYFAMRVAIARHLSQKVKLPFFLDDPFVNFDQERLDVTRELLEKLGDHQVIMVTCDRDYESWNEDGILDLDHARAESMVTGGAVELKRRAS